MNKPIGALDCDDSLHGLMEEIIPWINQKYDKDWELSQLTSYDLISCLGEDRQFWGRIFGEFAQLHERDNIPQPYEGAAESVGRLAVKYELVIITARPADEKDIVEKFVDRYFGGHISDIITRTGEHSRFDKGEIVDYLNADFLLDDHIEHAKSVISRGRKAVLFGDLPRTAPYRNDFTYAANWSEVEDCVNQV